MKKKFLLIFLLSGSITVFAQPSNDKIPLSRLFFHESIEATQKKIMLMDKVSDNLFTPTANESLNHELTKAVTQTIPHIEDVIEADTTLDNNNKIKFLR